MLICEETEQYRPREGSLNRENCNTIRMLMFFLSPTCRLIPRAECIQYLCILKVERSFCFSSLKCNH